MITDKRATLHLQRAIDLLAFGGRPPRRSKRIAEMKAKQNETESGAEHMIHVKETDVPSLLKMKYPYKVSFGDILAVMRSDKNWMRFFNDYDMRMCKKFPEGYPEFMNNNIKIYNSGFVYRWISMDEYGLQLMKQLNGLCSSMLIFCVQYEKCGFEGSKPDKACVEKMKGLIGKHAETFRDLPDAFINAKKEVDHHSHVQTGMAFRGHLFQSTIARKKVPQAMWYALDMQKFVNPTKLPYLVRIRLSKANRAVHNLKLEHDLTVKPFLNREEFDLFKGDAKVLDKLRTKWTESKSKLSRSAKFEELMEHMQEVSL